MEKKLENLLRGRKFMTMIEHRTSDIRDKYSLNNSELSVLVYLSRNEKLNTARDINDSLELTKGYVSKVLDSLCSRGYITAVPDENDRRYVHYTLNDCAFPVLDEIKQSAACIKEGLLSGISEEEIVLLRKTVIKINDNIDALMK